MSKDKTGYERMVASLGYDPLAKVPLKKIAKATKHLNEHPGDYNGLAAILGTETLKETMGFVFKEVSRKGKH